MLPPDVTRCLPVEPIAERSELLILAVPDDELPGSSPTWRPGSITAGQIPGAHHRPSRHQGSRTGDRAGRYRFGDSPAMTFTGMSVDLQRLNGTCFAVTGPAPFIPIAQGTVVEMGGEPVHVAEADRALPPALAYAANHLVTILGQSQQMLVSIGPRPGTPYKVLIRAAVGQCARQR